MIVVVFVLVDWIWNFLLSFFAPKIAADIGPLILLIFFGALVFGWCYVYLFIPETKGLSLEEVRFIYSRPILPSFPPSLAPSPPASLWNSALAVYNLYIMSFVFIPIMSGKLICLGIEIQVDEMYTAGVKPWRSKGWKPHLMDHVHDRKHNSDIKEEHVPEKGDVENAST